MGFFEIRDTVTFCGITPRPPHLKNKILEVPWKFIVEFWLSMVADDCGYLWMCSANYLLQLDPSDFTFVHDAPTAPYHFINLTYRDHQLYGIHENAVYRIDTEDPSRSELVFRLAPVGQRPYAHEDSVAFASARTSCDSWVTYVFSRQKRHPTIPRGISRLEWPSGRLTLISTTDTSYFWGVTAVHNDTFNCPPRLALDSDNSTGVGPYNYRWAGPCPESSIPIVDEDVDLQFVGLVAEVIEIELTGVREAGLEYLDGGGVGGSIVVDGSGTRVLRLSAGAGATEADFEEALRAIRYVYASDCPLAGRRTVRIRLRTCGGDTLERYGWIDIPEVGCAGRDTVVDVCDDVLPIELDGLLGARATSGGRWVLDGKEVSNTAEESGVYYYVVDRKGCSADTAVVELMVTPMPVFDFGPDTMICTAEGRYVLRSPVVAEEYRWSTGSRDTAIEVRSSGQYALTLTNGGRCSWADTVSIDLGRDTLIDLGEVEICWGDSVWFRDRYVYAAGVYVDSFVTVSGCDSVYRLEVMERRLEGLDLGGDTVMCDGRERYVLDAEVGGVVSYRWQDGSRGPRYEVRQSGLYWVEVTDSTGCRYRDSIRVVIGEDVEVDFGVYYLCRGDTLELGGRRVTTEGRYSDTLRRAGGCDSIVWLELRYYAEVEEAIEWEGRGCAGDTVWLEVVEGISGVRWSTGGEGRRIGVTTSGRYWITGQDEHGCRVSDTVEVEMYDRPEVSLVLRDERCEGSGDGALRIVPKRGEESLQYLLNGEELEEMEVEGLEAGQYTLVVIDSNGCSAEYSFSIGRGGTVEVDLGEDIAVWRRDTTVWITASLEGSRGVGGVRWTVGGEEFGGSDSLRIAVSGVEGTVEVCVQVEDTLGCVGEDCLMVRLVEPSGGLYIPNAFTPNGDGLNDVWTVYPAGGVEVLRVRVYDRWGELVYESGGGVLGWDGRFRGEEAPAGVYVYVVEYRDGEGRLLRRAGDVTLVR